MTFEEIGILLGKLVEEKNKAYGNSFEYSCKILEVLFPNGIQKEQYRDLLAITRVIDKLFRIATNKDSFGENPWMDIGGYSILSIKNKEKDVEFDI